MNLKTRLTIAAVGGALIGALPTLYFTRKHYSDLADREIQQVQKHYRITRSKPDSPEDMLPEKDEAAPSPLSEPSTLVDILKSTDQIIKDQGYTQYDKPKDEPMKEKNVFDREETPDSPTIITANQFIDLEPDITQITLTYYVADDTLANEEDETVDSLGSRFPEGWRDLVMSEKTLYILDDRRGQAYEIVIDPNSYATVVLGE